MTSSAPAERGPAQGPARLVAALTALALSLTLAACGGADEDKAKKPDSQPVEGGSELAALWPLTGQPVTGATPKHPVLIAKIDNTPSGGPQVGLKKADLITEQLVEGGMTRLAVFFYRRLPAVVGPVRSLRASDLGIGQPALAAIVASGGAPPTLRRLKAADVTFFEEGGPGYYRDSARRSPYNLMVNLPKLAKTLRDDAVVPASYLPWGTEADFTSDRPARSIDAVFSRSMTTSWRYQGGRYRNDKTLSPEGDRFLPTSILVVRVRLGDAGYLDPAGNKVPETIYRGRGRFLLFHRGKMVSGTWSKQSNDTPIQLSNADGEVKVPAGQVWVELVPTQRNGGRVSFAK